MNPIVKVKKASHFVIYKLTDKDWKKLNQTSLMEGAGSAYDHEMHKMCIMQAVSMVSTQERRRGERGETSYQDNPTCVSPTIASFLIELNDSEQISKRQRNSLKKLIPEILNTAPIKRKYFKTKVVDTPVKSDPAFKAAEEARRELLGPDEDIHEMLETRGGFAKAVKKVEEAAALYHAPDTGADEDVLEIVI